MPVNPHFNHVTFVTEQNLIEDLIIESIQVYGHMCYYIPREDVALDTLLGEDGLSSYITAYPVEVYLKTFDSFSGQSEFISKFGLHIEDQANFTIASKRFFEATANTLPRPRENDLLYIEFSPTNRYLFEIRFVENKEQLFQLGKLYTYELRCEMMNFSHESVATNVPEINEVAQNKAYQVEIAMEPGGAGDFLQGEAVYQGTSFITSVATGTVYSWDNNTRTLLLSDVTGKFTETDRFTGITSGAIWLPRSSGDGVTTSPAVADPLSDNAELATEADALIVNRGMNPITGS